MKKNLFLTTDFVIFLMLVLTVYCGQSLADKQQHCRYLLRGDVNGDCVVDMADVHLMASKWLGVDDCIDNCADVNEDEQIDGIDLAILSEAWQQEISVVINEFMASNSLSLQDEDGSYSDWIELYNYSSEPVNLQGWYLTDDKGDLRKWQFPSVTLLPDSYLVVFASSKNRTNPTNPLHTNFNLGSDGDYLALVKPDGVTVAWKYGGKYPTQYEDVSYGLAWLDDAGDVVGNYFTAPTPDSENADPQVSLGPVIEDISHSPAQPLAGDPLVVTATITKKIKPISQVKLRYRAMYNSESQVSMYDDGVHGDGVAGDGVYGATIPAGIGAAGQMIRYNIYALDDQGGSSRNPLALDTVGNNQSPQYYGTVVAETNYSTELPVFEWFTTSVSAAHNRAGTRACVYYDGEFYDNVFVRQRGGYTNQHISQKYDFNKSQKFRVNDELGRVDEINMNGNGADSSFIRQSMAFEAHCKVGTPSCESFMMYMRVNGNYDRVGIFIEQVDGDFLKRYGKDPDGALYKFVQRTGENQSTSQQKYWPYLPHTPVLSDTDNPGYNGQGAIQKKSRKWEDFSDIQEVVDALTSDDENVRRRFIFDNFNLPEMMNYLAARAVINDCDDTRKNFYFYRDSDGTGLWEVYPWDNDFTFGVYGDGGPHRAHPFFADEDHLKTSTKQWNVFYEAMFDLPETREMYLRRLRTVMDEFLQPPGTAQGMLKFEALCDEWAAPLYQHLGIGSAVNSTKNFFPSRRNELYVTYGPGGSDPLIPDSLDEGSSQFVETDTLIAGDPGQAEIKYLVPTNDSLGLDWIEADYNDDSWSLGYSGIGYERSPGNTVNYTSLIATDINSAMSGKTSVYVRIPFNVTDPSAFDALQLGVKYDDGYVAFLNGQEINRKYLTGSPAWNSRSSGGRSDSLCVEFEYMMLPAIDLVAGENVLAIQGVNSSSSSSDLLILPKLTGGVNTVSNPAVLDIEIGQIEYNPASGNQDHEYVEIVNNSETAVDISGWHLTGGVDFSFEQGTVIISGGSLYVSPDVTAFRQRLVSPKANEGRFVTGPYKGHLSSWGETINLCDDNYSVIDSVSYAATPTDQQRFLRVGEVMYHPAAGGDFNEEEYEFVELVNISDVPLVLDGTKLTNGILYEFTQGDSLFLPEGGRGLLVKNLAAYESRYGPGHTILGVYTGSLSNTGETIKLEDSTNSTILEFDYNDGWYPITDGEGFSLTFIDPVNTSHEVWDLKMNWRASSVTGGTPGADDTGDYFADGAIVINEILAHSHDLAPDWIELFNTTESDINIGGWFLSDDADDFKKYMIPEGTVISAGQYVVFYEDLHFGGAFALSENGETVYLSAGLNGELTGYSEKEDFGASVTNVAFGRYQKSSLAGSTFNFVAMSENTPGDDNAEPLSGPVVITEIMYSPADNSSAEYVELVNVSNEEITLYDYTVGEPWKFEDENGIEFYFPTPADPVGVVTMQPNDHVLLVKDAAAFNAEFTAEPGVRILEWSSGKLSNEGEKVQLSMPGDIDTTGTRMYIRVDRVVYDNTAPWPTDADGTGKSLQRTNNTEYGNDVINWQASTPDPGR